jgi:hypothetical protein
MRALVACWIVFLAPLVGAGESVLYSVTERSILYPATNRPVKASTEEDKTEGFAIDPETGKKRQGIRHSGLRGRVQKAKGHAAGSPKP